MSKSIKNTSDKFWGWVIVGVFIFIIGAFVVTALIEYGREHGSGPVSAIFTPGRQSTENILGILSSAFGLFSSMSAGMSFFILGKVSGRSKLRKSFKRVGIIALFAFWVFIIGFFSSLYFIFYSNSTGTATTLDTIYNLIRLFIAGLGLIVTALLSILKISF